VPIFEDVATTKLYEDRKRSTDGTTKGFRHITEIGYDDLTYKALQHFTAFGLRDFFLENVMSLGDNILQSPIERVVFAFFLLSDFGIGMRRENIHVVLPGEPLPAILFKEKSVAICPQHQIEGYYLDFGIFINTGDFNLAFDFECDGIEFHGSRNAQISHDYRRDIVLSENRFQIYRCSGANINRHPLYEVEKFGVEIETQTTAMRSAA
jgi:hypothetical protein